VTAAQFTASFISVYKATIAAGISVQTSAITIPALRRGIEVTSHVNFGTDSSAANTASSNLLTFYKGNFASSLQTALTNAGLNVTVGTVTVTLEPYTQSASSIGGTPSSSSSSGLAGWAIALIIIACILCLAACGAVVYYMMANPKHAPSDRGASAVSIHKDPKTHSESLDSAVTMGSTSSGKDMVEDRVPPAL
jgi:hypothetical protein